MSKLNASKRNKLKSSIFGLPKQRKYPMPDKAHAANAKARATQMENKGKLSESEKEKIDRKANSILGRSAKHKSGQPMQKKQQLKDEYMKMDKKQDKKIIDKVMKKNKYQKKG
jgi:phage-related protein